MLHRNRKKHRLRHRKLLLLVLTVLLFFEFRLQSVCSSVTETQAQSMAVELINQSICEILSEMNISAENLEELTLGKDNRIAAVNLNTVLSNQLKSAVTLRIQQAISNIHNRQIDIPLGLILGGEWFSQLGPTIPVWISLSGHVESDFDSSFESGGINQTVHRLAMKVKCDIRIILPLGSAATSVETSVLIGETVIVGETPNALLPSGNARTNT